MSLAQDLHSASDGREWLYCLLIQYRSLWIVVLVGFLPSFLPQVACHAWLIGTDWYPGPFSSHRTAAKIPSILHWNGQQQWCESKWRWTCSAGTGHHMCTVHCCCLSHGEVGCWTSKAQSDPWCSLLGLWLWSEDQKPDHLPLTISLMLCWVEAG